MSTSKGSVVVVGAGVAGLVASRHLARRGFQVHVFERESTVGGRVRSTHADGFVFDRGFQVLFTAYPAAQRELDYDDLALRRFAPGAVLARPGHRSILSDPLRDPGTLTETVFNRDITLGDKWRVLQLRRALRRKSLEAIFSGRDTTIHEYLAIRGFSTRFVERFAAPFYGGITLDRSLSTSSHVFEFTFKMLSAGDAAVPAEGMGAIPAQLASSARDAGVEIHTRKTVQSVFDGPGPTVELDGETVAANAVVVATDPTTARELTGVESIPTEGRGCLTQYIGLPHETGLSIGTRLVLNTRSDGPNQVAPMSSIAPEYAPDGQSLLSATYLGPPEADESTLVERTRETLVAWFPARDLSTLDHLHSERVEFAQFAQPPGIFETLPDARTPDGYVYLAGDFTRGSSINAAMEGGRRAARAVIEDLRY